MIHINDAKIQPFETAHIEALRKVSAECVLLLKKDGTLPLEKAGKIALYGSGARQTIKGGTGSGDVNVRHFVTIEEGLENAGFTISSKKWLDLYDRIKTAANQKFAAQIQKDAKEFDVNPVMYAMGKSMPEPEYELPLEGDGNAAVYVLSRNSGEGADRRNIAGDIDLTQTEIRDITKLNEMYEKFVLVLNIGGMVNLEPVANVKNIMLLGQLGTATGDVFADLLLGKTYPSGKLAMTWAPIRDYASTEEFGDMDDTCYREGIYVGYRYFDTVKKVPAFPFGYGLSYTDFKLRAKVTSADEKQIKVSVEVINTGKYKGKEVVQVYVSAPQGKLDKPYQELKGFAKTDELQAGESQTVEVVFETKDMASYSTEQAAYVLEAGDYIIRAGNSSRSTEICGIIKLDKEAVTERVKNICPGWNMADYKPEVFVTDEKKDAVSCFTIHSDRIESNSVKYGRMPEELPNKGYCNWDDVVTGKKSLEEFVGFLTEEQMTYLCNGNFKEEGGIESQIGASAVSIAGGAGETTFMLADLNVPTITMADGPAGVRLCSQYKIVNGEVKGIDHALANIVDSVESELESKPAKEELEAPINYVYCTAIPIGTALAQSWNEEIPFLCGDIVGQEMEQFGVNLWLAPAQNIQRSPLCGRNFEYFSEDPYISGAMAAAITRAVQRYKGCGTTIKHFVCNNQETNRMVSNSIVSERALREIYLKGFEICVKKSNPISVMSSYNLVNGEHTCNSRDLLTCVLRDEWGYNGLVMTDWYAASTLMDGVTGRKNKHHTGIPSGCIKAGNDIVMPGTKDERRQMMDALKNLSVQYSITKAELQVAAKRVLEAILKLS